MLTGLDSAAAKVNRATEHLHKINRIIHDVTSAAGAYEIVKDANGREIVNFLIEPPLDVAIFAGEIVYQLRSALDHLAFELVKMSLNLPDERIVDFDEPGATCDCDLIHL